MACALPARRTGTNNLPPVKEGSDLLSAWRDMSPEERDALNQAIKQRHDAGLEKRRPKVSPTQLERFEQKTRDYRLEGKTAWLQPHRDALRSFVVTAYEAGADNLDDLRILRVRIKGEELDRFQRDQFMRIALAWLRQLDKVCSIRLSKQLSSIVELTDRPHPLNPEESDWLGRYN